MENGKQSVNARVIAIAIMASVIGAAAASEQARRATTSPLPGVTDLGAVTMEQSSRFRMSSRAVGKPFIVDVVRVDAAGAGPASGGKLPVVFVTDNDIMGIASGDNPDIAEATPRLDARIRAHARPGLAYTYKVFADETHESLFPSGIMAGLRAVFDRPSGVPAPSSTAR